MPVIDGTPKFTCRHQFVGLGFGFSCLNCGHFRNELALDQKRSLLFFPTSKFVVEDFDATDADIQQAYGISLKSQPSE